VRARGGDLGIIPGSMGARSFIVRGRGNAESFDSCSHGAGRAMSRSKAKKQFTLQDHAAATAGVECRKDEGVLDETPGAYKDIEAVMQAQADLVDVVHTPARWSASRAERQADGPTLPRSVGSGGLLANAVDHRLR
jgi:tRNA-splicing ligase RtcB